MIDRDVCLGVVLAGGLSRRMGGNDKSAMPLAGRTLLSKITTNLATQLDDLIINSNEAASRFVEFPHVVVPDVLAGRQGPLAGILTGLEYADEHCPTKTHVLSVACDTPFFPTDLAQQMFDRVEGNETVVIATSYGQVHPVFSLWPLGLRHAVRHWLQNGTDRRIMGFLEGHNVVRVDFPPYQLADGEEVDPFFNVNSPHDLELAQKLAAQLSAYGAESHD